MKLKPLALGRCVEKYDRFSNFLLIYNFVRLIRVIFPYVFYVSFGNALATLISLVITAPDILSVQLRSTSLSNFLSTMRNWCSDMPFWTSSFFIFIILSATTLTLSKCETMDEPNISASPGIKMRSDKEANFRYIINPPLFKCPKHQRRDHLGKCRDILVSMLLHLLAFTPALDKLQKKNELE